MATVRTQRRLSLREQAANRLRVVHSVYSRSVSLYLFCLRHETFSNLPGLNAAIKSISHAL